MNGIDATATIEPTAIIGVRFRPLLDGRRIDAGGYVEIGPRCWIGHFCTVGEGARIGAGSIVEEHAAIGARVQIGERVLVTARSQILLDAKIGDDCVISGYIGDSCIVGARSRIFGELIHRQLDPTRGWDDEDSAEPPSVVEEGAFVGWRATVIGGVTIGAGAYICAGALITKDVPPGHIAYGRNEIATPADWPGSLRDSPFFHA